MSAEPENTMLSLIADLWNPQTSAAAAGGAGYGSLLEALRTFHDSFAGAAPDDRLTLELTACVNEWSSRLRASAVSESLRVDGSRPDLPGRGSLLLPPVVIDERRDGRFSGRVRLGRFTLGGNGAVHGGVIGLLFDELLGGTASIGDRGPARTVHLAVDFRAITPVGEELRVETRLDRVDGRKRYVTGELRSSAGDLLAEGRALCIALKAGQR